MNFFSTHISGVQRLASGNTLICEGAKGAIFEATPDRDVVWHYVNPNWQIPSEIHKHQLDLPRAPLCAGQPGSRKPTLKRGPSMPSSIHFYKTRFLTTDRERSTRRGESSIAGSERWRSTVKP